jgi:hypothetical protein
MHDKATNRSKLSLGCGIINSCLEVTCPKVTSYLLLYRDPLRDTSWV